MVAYVYDECIIHVFSQKRNVNNRSWKHRSKACTHIAYLILTLFRAVYIMFIPPNKDVWLRVFASTFEELEDRVLPPESYPSFHARNPLKMDGKGEAIYICFRCNRRWGSANGNVAIDYRLSIENNRLHFGDVKLSVFGQKCNRCNGAFVAAQFTEESIDVVLEKLLRSVKEKFYNEVSDRPARQISGMLLRGDHDSERCEACKYGRCSANRSDTGRTRGGGRGNGGFRWNSGASYGSDLKIPWKLKFNGETLH